MTQLWLDFKELIPSGQEAEIFFGALLLCFSVGFSTLISWLMRRDDRASEIRARVLSQNFDSIQTAFIVAGPRRSLEMALFLLVRDNWLQADGQGLFRSRLQNKSEIPVQLSELEREILSHLIECGQLSVMGLLRLHYTSLEVLESQLVKQGLVLSEADYQLGSRLSISPLLATMALALIRLYWVYRQAPASGPLSVALLIGLIFSLGFIFRIRKKFGRRSNLGDELQERVLSETYRRARPDANGSKEYDLMWKMKDDLLLQGLRALAGTAFAPLATFSELAAEQPQPLARSTALGESETQPGILHSSKNSVANPLDQAAPVSDVRKTGSEN